MFRSTPRPDLGWGRPIAAVSIGILGPAMIAGLTLWIVASDLSDAANPVTRLLWFVAACLTATPLFAWIAVPLAAPLVRVAVRRGWAGAASMIGLAWVIGLPLAHVVLNGDLTNEAPEMIPVLATALAVQALSGWCVLRLSRNVQTSTSTAQP